MAVTQSRKLKIVTFSLAGITFQCQLQKWNIKNNSPDGEKFYTFCGPGPEGEFREDAEPDYSLEMTFFSDWRSAGISDYLTVNDLAVVAFLVDHHPDIVGEHVKWTGSCKIKAPDAGGEARKTEMTEITIPIIGKPTYTRIP